MSGDRNSIAETQDLIIDPIEKAQREVENGFRQFQVALETIRNHVGAPQPKFKLKTSLIIQLHQAALDGIHPLAGTFRNTPVSIEKSKHVPPKSSEVADEVASLCEYVNNNFEEKTAVHLGSYVLWKLNWIHPFADGNGRTSRSLSYIVMSVKLNSILPGLPSIPDQIDADKNPYYAALEHADAQWKGDEVDVSELEKMLDSMLAKQLVNAAEKASGNVRWGLGPNDRA